LTFKSELKSEKKLSQSLTILEVKKPNAYFWGVQYLR